VTLKPGLWATQVIGTDRDRFAAYNFLLTFRNNHGPISYRFRENGDFSRKSQIFPTPVYLTPPLKGSPWNWVPALGVKKLEWWGYQAEQEVWRYLQPCGYNAPTCRTGGQMDRRTDTARQHRPRLRI